MLAAFFFSLIISCLAIAKSILPSGSRCRDRNSLSRGERGLVGILHVEGQPNPEIFDGKVKPGSGH